MAEITLYGVPQSTYTWTARLACVEKGVTHELQPVQLGTPEHRSLHPFVRIPVMRHGDFALYESGAISRYVDEAFDGPRLQPADLRTRARMNQWVSAFKDYFAGPMIRDILLPRLGIRPLNEAALAETSPLVEQRLAIADAAVSEGGYLAGSERSLADLFLLPLLFWLDKVPEGAALRGRFAALERWQAAMQARPSFAATVPPMPARAAAE